MGVVSERDAAGRAGQLLRVTSIALVAEVYGQELAAKAYHEYSGFIVFAVALSTMVIIGLLLNFRSAGFSRIG